MKDNIQIEVKEPTDEDIKDRRLEMRVVIKPNKNKSISEIMEAIDREIERQQNEIKR